MVQHLENTVGKIGGKATKDAIEVSIYQAQVKNKFFTNLVDLLCIFKAVENVPNHRNENPPYVWNTSRNMTLIMTAFSKRVK